MFLARDTGRVGASCPKGKRRLAAWSEGIARRQSTLRGARGYLKGIGPESVPRGALDAVGDCINGPYSSKLHYQRDMIETIDDIASITGGAPGLTRWLSQIPQEELECLRPIPQLKCRHPRRMALTGR
jgi:hypothetical protein